MNEMPEFKPLVITNAEEFSFGNGRMEISGNRDYVIEMSVNSTRIYIVDGYQMILETKGSMLDPGAYLQQREFIEYTVEMLKKTASPDISGGASKSATPENSFGKILIPKLEGLDPITVFHEDFKAGHGRMTIICFGSAWTRSWGWGAMGDRSVLDFFGNCAVDYLANSLSDIRPTVIDYDAVSKTIGESVEEGNVCLYMDELAGSYGEHWQSNLPHKPNHEYEYLCRVIVKVREHIKQEHLI